MVNVNDPRGVTRTQLEGHVERLREEYVGSENSPKQDRVAEALDEAERELVFHYIGTGQLVAADVLAAMPIPVKTQAERKTAVVKHVKETRDARERAEAERLTPGVRARMETERRAREHADAVEASKRAEAARVAALPKSTI